MFGVTEETGFLYSFHFFLPLNGTLPACCVVVFQDRIFFSYQQFYHFMMLLSLKI